MKAVLLFLLIFFTGIAEAQIVNFVEIEHPGNEGASFNIGNMNMVIFENGKGYLESGRKKTSSFKLSLPKNYYIEKFMYAVNTKDVYIVYQYTNDDDAAGFAACYDVTMQKIKWTVRVPGFNIGEPLVFRDYLYLTALGWVGKVNVLTGKFEWQIRNLYTDDHFYNDFEQPYLNGGQVIFKEGQAGLYARSSSEARLLVVDNITGKIISGKPKKK